MSGLPGLSSPTARAILGLALWVENLARRRNGKAPLGRNGAIRLDLDPDRRPTIPVSGRIGDRDVALGFAGPLVTVDPVLSVGNHIDAAIDEAALPHERPDMRTIPWPPPLPPLSAKSESQ